MWQKILQWCTNRSLKKSVEPAWSPEVDVPDEPVSTELIPSIPAVERAKEKRNRRKSQRRNHYQRGAFGKSTVMRRERE